MINQMKRIIIFFSLLVVVELFNLSFATELVYSTFIGGSNVDYGQGITLDSAGNTYIIGGTISRDFPTTLGAFDVSYNGDDEDVWIAKLNIAGSALVYSTYLGGNALEKVASIVVDKSGNAYITGYTNSSDFPTTPGAFGISSNGSDDAYVSKFNSTGSVLMIEILPVVYISIISAPISLKRNLQPQSHYPIRGLILELSAGISNPMAMLGVPEYGMDGMDYYWVRKVVVKKRKSVNCVVYQMQVEMQLVQSGYIAVQLQ